jgi:hypothetical protein
MTIKQIFLSVACLVLVAPGCRGQPTTSDLENRRLLDAIITAISLGNAQWLADDEQLLRARHQAGHLTDDEFRRLDEIIGQARRGESGALAAAYAFRKDRPFAKPGR